MNMTIVNVVLASLLFTGALAFDWKQLAKNGVIPDVIPREPNQIAEVYWGIKEADLGNEVTPDDLEEEPSVWWNPYRTEYYTVIMTNPDAPSRADPNIREFRHWHVVNIPGNSVTFGDVVAKYIGTDPPAGTGLHRYVVSVWRQKEKLRVTENIGEDDIEPRKRFNTTKYAIDNNLIGPIACNFVQIYMPVRTVQMQSKKRTQNEYYFYA